MTERVTSPLLTALERYYGELTAYVTRQLGCSMLAAEIVHEACLRLGRLPASVAIDNPRAYLFRVVTNVTIDHQRREQSHSRALRPEPLSDGVADGAPSQDTVLDERRRLAMLRQAIDELPPKCRQVFILRKFEGLEQAEIAARLGISRNMVEKHLRKALLHCRARLDQLLQ